MLDNRRILRRRAVFLHGVHSADSKNRRRSLSRHTPPKRIHSNKLAARAVHDRVRADSRRMADDKLSAPAAHFLEAVHRRADYIYNVFSLPPVGLFGEKASAKQRYIFACSVPLAVFLPCLNPSAFWFAGSFTFLVPFAALLITVTPLTFEVFGERVNPIAYIAAAIASVVAASQEQSCAAVLALQVILLIFRHINAGSDSVNSFRSYRARFPPLFWFSRPGFAGAERWKRRRVLKDSLK